VRLKMSKEESDWYSFRDALFEENFQSAEAMLQGNHKLLVDCNGIGEAVLHFLAVENCRKAIEWLVTKGANINVKNKFGTPLIFEVAQLGYKDLYLWLSKNGSDKKQLDGCGQTICDYLRDNDKMEMARWVALEVQKSA
ncbi:ankyrin repeat domain-containing protein, partial [Roseibacillus persicicus]|uniref:ankyrin repeat domain-containing protein n=1 Tax=Roseibacillus persicicus TaxID=454148 RepID=UPI00280E172C